MLQLMLFCAWVRGASTGPGGQAAPCAPSQPNCNGCHAKAKAKSNSPAARARITALDSRHAPRTTASLDHRTTAPPAPARQPRLDHRSSSTGTMVKGSASSVSTNVARGGRQASNAPTGAAGAQRRRPTGQWLGSATARERSPRPVPRLAGGGRLPGPEHPPVPVAPTGPPDLPPHARRRPHQQLEQGAGAGQLLHGRLPRPQALPGEHIAAAPALQRPAGSAASAGQASRRRIDWFGRIGRWPPGRKGPRALQASTTINLTPVRAGGRDRDEPGLHPLRHRAAHHRQGGQRRGLPWQPAAAARHVALQPPHHLCPSPALHGSRPHSTLPRLPLPLARRSAACKQLSIRRVLPTRRMCPPCQRGRSKTGSKHAGRGMLSSSALGWG